MTVSMLLDLRGTGAATSRSYWVAGWLPSGARLVDARGTDSGRAEYGRGTGREDVSIQVNAPEVARQLPPCNPDARGVHVTTIRGHAACQYTDSDGGNPFGTILVWREEPGVILDVELYSLDVAVARHVAEQVKPVDAKTWKRLVESTRFISRPDANMQREVVASGTVDGAGWTLTALIPKGFPLGPEDQRNACTELRFRGESSSSCGTGASQFIRLANKVFAYGSVHRSVRRVGLHAVVYGTNSMSTGNLVSTVDTHPAKPARARFYASPLPDDNCGVDVLDVDNPATRVGFAPGRPFDALCSGRQPGEPLLPAPNAVPRTAPR
jgi:hypothetical protein